MIRALRVALAVLLALVGLSFLIYGPANIIGFVALLFYDPDPDPQALEDATSVAHQHARGARSDLIVLLADLEAGDGEGVTRIARDAVENVGGQPIGDVVVEGSRYRLDAAFQRTGHAPWGGRAEALLCVRYEGNASADPALRPWEVAHMRGIDCPPDLVARVSNMHPDVAVVPLADE